MPAPAPSSRQRLPLVRLSERRAARRPWARRPPAAPPQCPARGGHAASRCGGAPHGPTCLLRRRRRPWPRRPVLEGDRGEAQRICVRARARATGEGHSTSSPPIAILSIDSVSRGDSRPATIPVGTGGRSGGQARVGAWTTCGQQLDFFECGLSCKCPVSRVMSQDALHSAQSVGLKRSLPQISFACRSEAGRSIGPLQLVALAPLSRARAMAGTACVQAQDERPWALGGACPHHRGNQRLGAIRARCKSVCRYWPNGRERQLLEDETNSSVGKRIAPEGVTHRTRFQMWGRRFGEGVGTRVEGNR